MRSKKPTDCLAAIPEVPIGSGKSNPPKLERRWGAILTVDVVEYSRLTILNAELAYFLYKSHRHELLDPKLREYRARFFKSTGDGIMAEFETALDAARCAVDVQKGMIERGRSTAKDSQVVFRMGLSCGPILADVEDIYGHNINVAARLQSIAPPGGIAMTNDVAACVENTLAVQLEDIGEQYFHNMGCPVHVFQCRFDDATVRQRKTKDQGLQQLRCLDDAN